jgi:hypothetical protein
MSDRVSRIVKQIVVSCQSLRREQSGFLSFADKRAIQWRATVLPSFADALLIGRGWQCH